MIGWVDGGKLSAQLNFDFLSHGGLMPYKLFEHSMLLAAPACDVAQWQEWNHLFAGTRCQFQLIHSVPGSFIEWERDYSFGTKLIQSFSVMMKDETWVVTGSLSIEGAFKKPVSAIMGRQLVLDTLRQMRQMRAWSASHRQLEHPKQTNRALSA